MLREGNFASICYAMAYCSCCFIKNIFVGVESQIKQNTCVNYPVIISPPNTFKPLFLIGKNEYYRLYLFKNLLITTSRKVASFDFHLTSHEEHKTFVEQLNER